MSPWLYLVLAHLVADFMLQPYELVRLKARPIGLALHVGIHAVLTAAVASVVLPRWWLVTIFVGVMHYGIDYAKVRMGAADGPASLAAFLLDQAAHFVILGAAVALAGVPFNSDVSLVSPEATAIAYYAVPYVATTFAGAVVVFQVALAFHTRSSPGDLLRPGLRVAGYAERGLILTLLLFLGPAFWWLGAAWYGVRFGVTWHRRGGWGEILAGLLMTVPLGLLFRQGV